MTLSKYLTIGALAGIVGLNALVIGDIVLDTLKESRDARFRELLVEKAREHYKKFGDIMDPVEIQKDNSIYVLGF